MKILKGVFDSTKLQSKTECNIDDVFGGENYDYEEFFAAEDVIVLKDKLHEGIWYVIDNRDDAEIGKEST